MPPTYLGCLCDGIPHWWEQAWCNQHFPLEWGSILANHLFCSDVDLSYSTCITFSPFTPSLWQNLFFYFHLSLSPFYSLASPPFLSLSLFVSILCSPFKVDFFTYMNMQNRAIGIVWIHFIPTTLFPRREEKHLVWAGIKPRSSCFTSDRSNH